MTDARLPDFVVIGAMKAGTTTLYEQLSVHPRIYMPALKELDFFIAERNWRRGLGWYHEQFAPAPSGALLGEASPNYTKQASFKGVPLRMREHIPNAKLIYILRDPIARIRSQYAHSVLSGRETKAPEAAITVDSGYLDTSLYAKQLEVFTAQFPREQIMLVLTEDLRDDADQVMRRIHAFLGIDHLRSTDPDRRANVTAERPGYGRIAGALRRQGWLKAATRKVLPARLYDLAKAQATREVAPERLAVPDTVFAPLEQFLCTDRELLARDWGIDASKWAALSAESS